MALQLTFGIYQISIGNVIILNKDTTIEQAKKHLENYPSMAKFIKILCDEDDTKGRTSEAEISSKPQAVKPKRVRKPKIN